jgi:hypothetical protein
MLFQDGFQPYECPIERRDGRYYRHEDGEAVQLPEDAVDVFMIYYHLIRIYPKYKNVNFTVEYNDGVITCKELPEIVDEIVRSLECKKPFDGDLNIEVSGYGGVIKARCAIFGSECGMVFTKYTDFDQIINNDGAYNASGTVVERRNGQYFAHLDGIVLPIKNGKQIFTTLHSVSMGDTTVCKKFILRDGELIDN